MLQNGSRFSFFLDILVTPCYTFNAPGILGLKRWRSTAMTVLTILTYFDTGYYGLVWSVPRMKAGALWGSGLMD